MRKDIQEDLVGGVQLGLDAAPAVELNGERGAEAPAVKSLGGKGQNAAFGRILTGDARRHLAKLPEACIDLSFWSPPYYVGKSYERHLSFDGWRSLLREVIHGHARIIKPGGFLAVNIGDILCFPDPSMPRFQANNRRRKKVPITKEQILAVKAKHPNANQAPACRTAGLQRANHSAPLGGQQRAWRQAGRLHQGSADRLHGGGMGRDRLTADEWASWGSRGLWSIRSVSRNNRHEAEFPEELAGRVIRLFSPLGGVVLDPFVGTGTTTAVAKKLGRQWLGIDIAPRYTRMAKRRTDGAGRARCAHSWRGFPGSAQLSAVAGKGGLAG